MSDATRRSVASCGGAEERHAMVVGWSSQVRWTSIQPYLVPIQDTNLLAVGVEHGKPFHVTAPDESALRPGRDNHVEYSTTVVGDRDEARPGWPVVIFDFILWHLERCPWITPVEPGGNHSPRGRVVERKRPRPAGKNWWIRLDREAVARPSATAVDFGEESTQLARKLDTQTAFEVGDLRRGEARTLNIFMAVRFVRAKGQHGDVEACELVELSSNRGQAFRNQHRLYSDRACAAGRRAPLAPSPCSAAVGRMSRVAITEVCRSARQRRCICLRAGTHSLADNRDRLPRRSARLGVCTSRRYRRLHCSGNPPPGARGSGHRDANRCPRRCTPSRRGRQRSVRRRRPRPTPGRRRALCTRPAPCNPRPTPRGNASPTACRRRARDKPRSADSHRAAPRRRLWPTDPDDRAPLPRTSGARGSIRQAVRTRHLAQRNVRAPHIRPMQHTRRRSRRCKRNGRARSRALRRGRPRVCDTTGPFGTARRQRHAASLPGESRSSPPLQTDRRPPRSGAPTASAPGLCAPARRGTAQRASARPRCAPRMLPDPPPRPRWHRVARRADGGGPAVVRGRPAARRAGWSSPPRRAQPPAPRPLFAARATGPARRADHHGRQVGQQGRTWRDPITMSPRCSQAAAGRSSIF
ncbi:Hypothetical protein A7982_04209 [Minicystis rosea]|nr:Hypothetical protein A7982_04209 [Minicystis rosea]